MDLVNPFDDLYRHCNTGDAGNKLFFTHAHGPLIIDVEPTSLCNLRCNFCPTGLQAVGRPSKYMSMETFRNVLRLTQQWNSAIRFIGWGEPFLNPHTPEMMKEARQDGRLVHVNTNATTLPQFVAAGNPGHSHSHAIVRECHSVKLSMQGCTPAKYLQMRGADKFYDVLKSAETLINIRAGLPLPFISISCTITDEPPADVEWFIERAGEVADSVSVGYTVTSFINQDIVPSKRLDDLARVAREQFNGPLKHPDPCPEVYNKLTVHWNGAARVCCNDYSGETNLGNVNEVDDLDAIWMHPEMVAYRKRLAEGEYTGPLCSNCFEYIDTVKE